MLCCAECCSVLGWSMAAWQRPSQFVCRRPPPPQARAASAQPSRPCTNVPFVMQMEAAFFSCTDTKFAVSTGQLLVRFQACSRSFFCCNNSRIVQSIVQMIHELYFSFFSWVGGGGVDWVSMHALRLQQLLWWREQATILRTFKQFLFISALSQTSVQLGPPKNLAFPGFAGRSSARFGKLLDHYSPRSERMLFFNNLCIWSHIYLHGKWQQALWDHFGGSMKSFLLSNILKKIAFRWHKDAQLLKIK